MSIKSLLNEKLDPKLIKSRIQNGNKLSYLEGYAVENNANKIFEYKYSKELLNLDKLFEREYVSKSTSKEMNEVAYKATVRIHVDIDGEKIYRDGTGFGNGQMGTLSGAYELAIKEAETDAMKRAFKSLGNQFGIELYDKNYKADANYNNGVAFSLELTEAIEKVKACTTKLQVREQYSTYKGAYKKEFDKACSNKQVELS